MAEHKIPELEDIRQAAREVIEKGGDGITYVISH